MAERLGNLGYFGLKKETTPGVAVTPDDFIPLYDESLSTQLNLIEDNPVAGNRYMKYQVLQGMRSHGGDFTVFAEANTTAKILDMMLKKSSTSGAGPYTHQFDFSGDSNSYTVDVSTGNHVFRLIGVKGTDFSPVYKENQIQWKVKASGLKSFYGRELASTPTGSGPYTVVLTTTYDPSPTTGLVVGDLIRFVKASDGTITDATVASIVNGTSITTTTNVTALGSGDFVHIRPATVTFNLRAAFLLALTEYRFGLTASAALSATHTPVEASSTFTISHNFEDDKGARRTGSFDPASLVRTQGDLKLKVKKYFDTPDEAKRFLARAKNALVIRMFSEGQLYECRLTFNNIVLKDGGKPMIQSTNIAYYEMEYSPVYDQSDGQAFDAKVLDALPTI